MGHFLPQFPQMEESWKTDMLKQQEAENRQNKEQDKEKTGRQTFASIK